MRHAEVKTTVTLDDLAGASIVAWETTMSSYSGHRTRVAQRGPGDESDFTYLTGDVIRSVTDRRILVMQERGFIENVRVLERWQ